MEIVGAKTKCKGRRENDTRELKKSGKYELREQQLHPMII